MAYATRAIPLGQLSMTNGAGLPTDREAINIAMDRSTKQRSVDLPVESRTSVEIVPDDPLAHT